MALTDREREQVVRDLTRHCGDGRLTLDELEERVAEAYAAETADDLSHALRELPRFRPEPVETTRAAASPAPAVPTAAARRARPAAAARCGVGNLACPPVFLIALTTLLFVTAHYVLAILLLVFLVPRYSRRAYARA